MKTRTILTALCATFISLSSALALDAYYVVTITDMLGVKTYEVVDKEKLATMKKEFATETKLFPKALAKLQKDWTANPDAHQFKWQGQKLKPRTIKESAPMADRQKAVEKADKMTDKELGLDEPAKKIRPKKLSEKEEEKAYQESLKKKELQELAESVKREIDEMAKTESKK